MQYFSLEDLQIGEEVATCPSCSLLIRVIYDQDQFADYESDEEVTNLAQGWVRILPIALFLFFFRAYFRTFSKLLKLSECRDIERITGDLFIRSNSN